MKNTSQTGQNTLLEARNLKKYYHERARGGRLVRAVNDVSFTLQKGRIISLIGESGSGKTTICKLLLRLLHPTSGRIMFGTTDIASIRSQRERRAYYSRVQGIFQEPFSSFNPLYKIDRVFSIAFTHILGNVSGTRERLDNCLAAVNLNPREVLGKFPHQFSGGELQRILIARTLLLNAEMLVADEMTSMLDASTRIDILNVIGKLVKDRNMGVLFVTHDISLGYYISDESLILHKGTVVETGDTRIVYHNPVHPYTKLLLRSVPLPGMKWERGESFLSSDIEEKIGLFYRMNRHQPQGLCAIEKDHFAVLKDPEFGS